jgi:predicted O-methyltransferase YrrM
MLHLSSGHVAWLREEIAALDDLGTFEAQVITNLYAEERDRVARVAKACLDSGVAERQVKLAETYGAALASLLRAVFNDRDLALTDAQRERLPDVLRRYLGALEADRALISVT